MAIKTSETFGFAYELVKSGRTHTLVDANPVAGVGARAQMLGIRQENAVA
jgi:hypothetical protein